MFSGCLRKPCSLASSIYPKVLSEDLFLRTVSRQLNANNEWTFIQSNQQALLQRIPEVHNLH